MKFFISALLLCIASAQAASDCKPNVSKTMRTNAGELQVEIDYRCTGTNPEVTVENSTYRITQDKSSVKAYKNDKYMVPMKLKPIYVLETAVLKTADAFQGAGCLVNTKYCIQSQSQAPRDSISKEESPKFYKNTGKIVLDITQDLGVEGEDLAVVEEARSIVRLNLGN